MQVQTPRLKRCLALAAMACSSAVAGPSSTSCTHTQLEDEVGQQQSAHALQLHTVQDHSTSMHANSGEHPLHDGPTPVQMLNSHT